MLTRRIERAPGLLREAAGLSLLYVATVWLSYAIGHDEDQVVAVWPAAGVMFYAAVRLGWWALPLLGVLDWSAAQVTLPGHYPHPLVDALHATANVVGLAAALALPDIRASFATMFDRTRAMLWFLTVAAGLTSAVSAVLAVMFLEVGIELDLLPHIGPLETMARWFLSNYVGTVIVAPLLGAWQGTVPTGASLPRRWQIMVIVAALVANLLIAAAIELPPGFSRFTLLLGLTPLLLWAALAGGPRALTLLILASGIGAGALTIELVVPQTGLHPETAMLIVQIYLLAAAVSALIAQAANREQVRLARERGNLARFFSPRVVDLVATGLEAAGRDRVQDAAVMFVDIRGFTSFAESEPPERVMTVLRGFTHRVEDRVFGHDGTLDKYLGDGVMATFGVPMASFADARNALACARDLLEDIAAWNRERAADGQPPIAVGIGVHYGPVVLGTIGSERTKSLSVLGDTVNTAARLQALSRELGTTLVVSHDLVAAMRREGHADAERLLAGLRPAGAHQVRGRSAATEIWILGS